MGLDFVQTYNGCRLEEYDPQPPLLPEPSQDERGEERVDLDFETRRDAWYAIAPELPAGWGLCSWPEHPVRFIDGSDRGGTVAWLRAPGGYPVPVRLSQVGGVAVRVTDGECHREFEVIQRVVSMVADVFPWEEIESFAAALQTNGLRLLNAQAPNGRPSYDFEEMRKVTEDRSNGEMTGLEELAVAQDHLVPTVVDGRLEPRWGGFDPGESPVFGVIKTHYRNYLHPLGMQLLYELEPGQRTPMFRLRQEKLPVVSWYLRLSGGGATPNWGLVRIEVASSWFESHGCDVGFADRLSQTIFLLRCRERSYGRAAVSLHPIVRAEESLAALFMPTGVLTSRFFRLTGL
jgi:hypothetical protein